MNIYIYVYIIVYIYVSTIHVIQCIYIWICGPKASILCPAVPPASKIAASPAADADAQLLSAHKRGSSAQRPGANDSLNNDPGWLLGPGEPGEPGDLVTLRSTPSICPASGRVRRDHHHHQQQQHQHQHHHYSKYIDVFEFMFMPI